MGVHFALNELDLHDRRFDSTPYPISQRRAAWQGTRSTMPDELTEGISIFRDV